MLLLTATLASLVVTGLAALAHWISVAPLGEQSERGFDMTWCNDRPEYGNVSCVWDGCEL